MPPKDGSSNSSSCTSENVGRLVTPAKKLEDTIRLAELVIEVLQQNEEHHAEVRTSLLWIFFVMGQFLELSLEHKCLTTSLKLVVNGFYTVRN